MGRIEAVLRRVGQRGFSSAAPGPASLAGLALTLAPLCLHAQAIDLSHGGPITVTAAGGIDWNQKDQTVIARGNARAVRGNATVDADVLTAHYRKKAGAPNATGKTNASGAASAPGELLAEGGKSAAGGPGGAAGSASAAPPPADGQKPGSAGPDDTGSNEIYRLNADGHVHIFTPTDQAWGDHAVYDIDSAVLVLTGHGLKLTTPQDILTARDSMEYWSAKHMAVARGDAVATSNDGRRIVADTLVGYTEDPNAPKGQGAAKEGPVKKAADVKGGGDPTQPGKLKRVEAYGHVIMTTPTEIVTADRGVYLPDTGLARVIGHVHVTRGENQLNGAAAIVNMKTGVATMTQAPGRRVQGLVVPNGSGGNAAPGSDEAGGKEGAKGGKNGQAAPAASGKGSP